MAKSVCPPQRPPLPSNVLEQSLVPTIPILLDNRPELPILSNYSEMWPPLDIVSETSVWLVIPK